MSIPISPPIPYDVEGVTADLIARNNGQPLDAETLALIAATKAASDAAIAAFVTPEIPATPVVLISVSRLRMKLALKDLDLLTTVEAVVASAGELAQIYWTESTMFERNHPMVVNLGAAAGLTPQEIDDIFINAATRIAQYKYHIIYRRI